MDHSHWPALVEDSLPTLDPIKLFLQWREEAKDVYHHNWWSVCLATASPTGLPSNRMLAFDYASKKDGFVFSTNKRSPKARDLSQNPVAAMCFYWHPRSVRVEGNVTEMSQMSEMGAKLLDKVPSENRIALAAFPEQSVPCKDRAAVDESYANAKKRADQSGSAFDYLEFWRSYQLKPKSIEFIYARQDWTSDRLKFYRKSDVDASKMDVSQMKEAEDGWVYQRLTP